MKMRKRMLSLLMVLAMLVGILPSGAFAAGTSVTVEGKTAEYIEKVADVSTQDVWSKLVNSYQSTKYLGRIWTDKTVAVTTTDETGNTTGVTLEYKLNESTGGTTTTTTTTMDAAADADFQVVLSAMSSSMSVEEQQDAPMDVVMILDISSSMYNGSAYKMETLDKLVTSVNSTIAEVQSLNTYNRVGVVLYYGGGRYELNLQSKEADSGLVLLELGRYTGAQNNQYVVLDKTNHKVSSASGLKKDNVAYGVKTRTLTDIAGTYMQLGILYAMNQFKSVNTTTSADADNIEHIPVFILMSDGEPTASTSNFSVVGDAEFGNNTVAYRNPAESDFVTQLTAAYAKAEVDDHYTTTTPLFYTLSLGDDISLDVMDPGRTISVEGANRDETDDIEQYWKTLLTQGSVTYNTYPHALEGTAAKAYKTTTTTLTNHLTFPSSIAQMQYVDKAFTAATAGNLSTAFGEIVGEIKTQLATSPTFTSAGLDQDHTGYVTMLDELGDFMEVKSMDAITIEGVVYEYNGTPVTTNKGDYTETTYEFTQSPSLNTVLEARQQNSSVEKSLGAILITERDYADPIHRDSVLVQIPVGLLPLRYYKVDKDGKLTIKETLPVRVVYSVGLLDSVRTALSTGNYSAVNGLTAYMAARNTDGTLRHIGSNGEIRFYSNYWDGEDSNEDGHTDGNTYSTFAPATTNSFYYYTRDTVFYRADGDGGYTPVTKSSGYEADLAGTVYYPHTYYTTNGQTTEYIGLNINAAINRIDSIGWGNIAKYIGINSSNQYYMIAGNAKLSLANATEFIDQKSAQSGQDANGNTDTASTVLNPTWNRSAVGGDYATYLTENYMGNNGRISFKGLGKLIVAKSVSSTASQSPDADTEFAFTITLGDTTTESVTYPATYTGASGSRSTTVTFTEGVANVTLKANESIIITLPQGTTYTVVETGAVLKNKDVSGAYTTIITDNDGTTTDGQGTIATNDTDTVTVQNTYKYTNIPVKVDITLAGTKTLDVATDSTTPSGTYTATFYLQTWRRSEGIDGAWVNVIGAEGTVVKDTVTYSASNPGTITYTNINAALKNYGFNAPGEYLFRIVEQNAGQTINGIYHDAATHSFEVTVQDNGDGTLSIANVASIDRTGSPAGRWSENNGAWSYSGASFTNEYGTTKLTIDIDKDIYDTTGSGFSDTKGYQFNWEYLGSYEDAQKIYSGLSYGGQYGRTGTSSTTTADGIARFSIVYDATDNVEEPMVDENGIHVYPSGQTTSTDTEKADEEATDETDDTTDDATDTTGDDTTDTTGDGSDSTTGDGTDSTTGDDTADTTGDGSDGTTGDDTDSTTGDDTTDTTDDGTAAIDAGITADTTDSANDGDTTDDTADNTTGDGTTADNTGLVPSSASADPDDETGGTLALIDDDDTSIAVTDGNYYEYYRITEASGSKAGITYSNASYIVQVVVHVEEGNISTSYSVVQYTNSAGKTYTYSDNNKWTATDGDFITRDDDDALIFANTYSASTTATLGITKTLQGRDWKSDDSFSFTLTPIQWTFDDNTTGGLRFYLDGTTAVVGSRENKGSLTATASYSENVTGSDVSASFGTITFTQVGTYYFEVTENAGNAGGITYSTDTIYAKVVVTADENHALSAAVFTYHTGNIDESDGILGTFTNIYAANPVSVTLSGTKTLSGRTLAAGEFSFGLYYDSNPNDELDGDLIASATNDAEGKYSFAPRTYTTPGTYDYKVKEIPGTLGGVTYDETEYSVTVTVTDNGSGQLVASVNNSDPTTSYSGLNFSNSYAATGEYYLYVYKTISGRYWLPGDSFTFGLYAEDPTVNPNQTPEQLIITAPESVPQETETLDGFFTIELDKAGTSTYYIKEETTFAAGGPMTADSRVYKAVITATDNGDGTLRMTPTFSIVDAEGTAQRVEFINTYDAADVQVALQVYKMLEGRDWEDTDSFTFTLTPNKADTPKPASNTVVVKQNTDSHIASFGTITYAEEGTYEYTIQEKIPEGAVNNTLDGITYDTTIWNVKVVVKDVDGRLKATVTYGENTGRTNAAFTNTAEPATVTLSGTKTLNGGTLKADDFSFVLIDSDDKELETVKNSADGTFSFSELKFAKAGTYTYTVSEVKDDSQAIIYDETIYAVEVTVINEEDGTLSASAAYFVSDQLMEELAFVNTHLPNAGKPAGFTIRKVDAHDDDKVLSGAEFTLYSDEVCKTPVMTRTTGKDGTAAFDDFTSEGTYYLKETKAPEDYQLPGTVWKVTVKLEDDLFAISIKADRNIFGRIYDRFNGSTTAESKWNGETLTLTVENEKAFSYIDVSVKKVWYDSDGSHPDSVGVTLYRDGEPHARVTLSKSNHWSHTWENLNDEFEWTVDEPSVPSGYNKKVRHRGNDWTITNIYEDIPVTGDSFDALGLLIMAAVGIAGFGAMVFLLIVSRKKGKFQK